MAGKRKENSQLYGIIALVAVVVFGVWAMVQLLNQNKVTTNSEARVRNTNRFPNIPRNPTVGDTKVCGRCDPASDSGCPDNFTCVDINSGKNNFPPDYRCVQVLNCNNPTIPQPTRACVPPCEHGQTCHDGECS